MIKRKFSFLSFAEREISLSKEIASVLYLLSRDLPMTEIWPRGSALPTLPPHLPPLPSSPFLKDRLSVPIFSVLAAAGLT